jgi:NitT/TauT family transport system substrate-binding protein
MAAPHGDTPDPAGNLVETSGRETVEFDRRRSRQQLLYPNAMTAPWLFLLGVLVASAIAALPAAAQPMTKMNIGYGFAADFLPAFVAKEEKIFEKNKIDATLTSFPGASLVPPAIISGSLQMGINTAPNLLLSAEAGIELVAVAGGARLTKENAKVALVTRKDLVVAKAEDLKGKRVGVPGINSIIEIFLRKWLINNKVPLKEVTIVEAGMPLMGDLVRTGQIDAVTPIEPILGRIVASGAGLKSVDFFSEVNPDVIGSFWTTMRPWAAANPAAIAGFRASLAEGLAFIRANPERARNIEEKYLHTTSAVMPSYTLDIKPQDFDFFVKLGVELGLNRRPVDTSTLVLN